MSDLYLYLLCSRNKDNKNVLNFKQRTKPILEYKENEVKVFEAFKNFAEKGVDGERTRLYRTVNSRNENKIRKEFIIKLLRDEPDITKFSRMLTSTAQQKCSRDENKWLFDFDVNDGLLVMEFVNDIYKFSGIKDVEVKSTPNGYHIVVPHGFDTRELMDKWKYCVTLKKDDLLFLDMMEKRRVR